MLFSVLGLGLLLGMQHALEADHVAAVSSVVSRQKGIRGISMHGAIWGLGHTLTLLLVAGTCIVLKTSLDDKIAERLEFGVGIMLVGMGTHVLWRLWRDRVHFGTHAHADGTKHMHAHSHKHDTAHQHRHSAHAHEHPLGAQGMPWRTLLVGTMHGMAGSAALVVLAASSIESPIAGLGYVLLFGLGSVVGMAALSAVIAVPLTWSAKSLTVANRALQACIGIVTIAVGARVIFATYGALFAA